MSEKFPMSKFLEKSLKNQMKEEEIKAYNETNDFHVRQKAKIKAIGCSSATFIMGIIMLLKYLFSSRYGFITLFIIIAGSILSGIFVYYVILFKAKRQRKNNFLH
jgi:sensor c-di-GMP phosphodiesterase-like protein